jgi:hypothetical protein
MLLLARKSSPSCPPNVRAIRTMGMVQHDRRSESIDDLAHFFASFPTNSSLFLTCPPPGAEHVQVMASKNEYTLACESPQVRAKVDHLYEITFLSECRIGFPGPEDASTCNFVYRNQLGMFVTFLTLTRFKIDPYRKDIDLSRSGL